MTANKTVCRAIDATKTYCGDYFANTCRQRLAGGFGSHFTSINTVEEMESNLKSADWRPASHPAVMQGCKAYVTTSIPGGQYGLVSISDLPDDVEITASDPKGTGKVSMIAEVSKSIPVQETWLIIGNNEGHEVVFTFHPGAPVRPSILDVKDCPDGTKLTKCQALELGFDLAKVVVSRRDK